MVVRALSWLLGGSAVAAVTFSSLAATEHEATVLEPAGLGTAPDMFTRRPDDVRLAGRAPNVIELFQPEIHGSALSGVGVTVHAIGPTGSGSPVGRVTTNTHGIVTLRDLKPGRYTLAIDGKSLAAAVGHRDGPPVTVELAVRFKGDLGGGWASGSDFSTTVSVCPDAPGDIGIGFTVPEGGGAVSTELKLQGTTSVGQTL